MTFRMIKTRTFYYLYSDIFVHSITIIIFFFNSLLMYDAKSFIIQFQWVLQFFSICVKEFDKSIVMVFIVMPIGF